jgi:A/G-specific adenine glycosylase
MAELLLQRTRADQVLRVYESFIGLYPDARSLAATTPAQVKWHLRQLGLFHRAARFPVLGGALVERHNGCVPHSKQTLLALPGVGPYVANAVLAVAHGQRLPLVDPNVIRLIGRYFNVKSARARPRTDPALWHFVGELLPKRGAPEFALALVDLGATICRPKTPSCPECPVSSGCVAFHAGAPFAD